MRLIFRKRDCPDVGQKNPEARRRNGDFISAVNTGEYVGHHNEPTHPKYMDNHIIVNVPDLDMTKSEVKAAYGKSWKHRIQWDEVASTDEGWRVKVWDNWGNATSYLSKDQVENFILNWGGNIHTFAQNEVIFNLGIFGIGTSNPFWGKDVSGAVFEQQDLNSERVRIRATLLSAWTDTPEKRQKIQSRIENHGCTIANFDILGSRVTFDLPRSVAQKEFREQVRDDLENRILRRTRFRIDESEVDWVIAQGNEATITKAQFLARIKDKVND